MQENIKREIEHINQLVSKLNYSEAEVSGEIKQLKNVITSSENAIEDFKYKRELYDKSIEILNLIQQQTKEKIKEGFESIVTYALQSVFGNQYKFEIEFGRRGNLSEIDFNIKTPNLSQALDPLDSSGVGVLDIISLALRISLLEITKPRIEGFIALDESFKHVSEGYLESTGAFLKAINRKINRQIILVTHQEALKNHADHIINL